MTDPKRGEGRIDFEFALKGFSDELTKELARVCKVIADRVELETLRRCESHKCGEFKVDCIPRLYSHLNDGKGER